MLALAVGGCGTPGSTDGDTDASADTDSSADTDATLDSDQQAAVARGAYLVDHVLVCGECHTPSNPDGTPDMTKYLAGSRSYDFTTGDGTVISVYAENLTPDTVEGVGAWPDDWIRGAIVNGLDDEKAPLWPIMPYPEYALLTTADVDAIIAYLRTIPASNNVVAPDTLSADRAAAPINGKLIPHTTLDKSDPKYASAERGRYLASVACLQCHTPELSPGNSDTPKAFSGGRKYTSRSDAEPSTSSNLTPDATGIAGWTVDDIKQTLLTNKEKGTGRDLCPTMPGGQHRMDGMSDGDMTDIANYLLTLPPVANGPFTCHPL